MVKENIEWKLLDMGWDTESTSSDKFRAFRGPITTQWHGTWDAVLAEVNALNDQAHLQTR